MDKRLLSISYCLLIFGSVFADKQSIKQTPDSLWSNAFAIVRNYDAVFAQTDLNNATFKVTTIITILNKQGEAYGYFAKSYDKFRELKDFSGTIKNASGTIVKKIGKKDLITSTLSDNSTLISDNYDMFYECKYPSYPYTVEYTYTEKWKNGILTYPTFNPMSGYLQFVEKANYTIELPATMKLRYKSNFDCNLKEATIGDKHIYTFSIDKMKAIDIEPLAPSSREVLPYVFIAPSDFCFDGVCGNMSDWNNYSKWASSLLKNRDILPDNLASKLKELTKDVKNDKDKVAILYKYLQENSRYVNIQLGIGGFQPIDATSVSKAGFGDCKGLTNLMKAMLKSIGIPSNYCEVGMGSSKSKLYKDFCNVFQTNHVILLVPLKNDSIWLECTSQKLPFGYVHDNIAGHDALVLTDNGGEICRISSYTDQQNRKESKLDITIQEGGVTKGSMTFTDYLHQYGYNFYAVTSKDREKEVAYINANVNFPKIQISQISTSEDKSPIPSCTLQANFEASDFTNQTGSRLFIPAYPLNKEIFNVFKSTKRTQDIVVDNGFSDCDTITFHIPESYTPESLPKGISLNTPFGTFISECKMEGNSIIYTQNIDIFTGRYDKEKYKEIKAFFAEINSAMKRKLVLKKT